MKIYDLKNYDKIFFLGDIYGEFNELKNSILRNSTNKKDESSYFTKLISNSLLKKKYKEINDMLNNSIIIVSGDCGIGLKSDDDYKAIFSELNDVLKEINSHLFFVRGNYDNPSYFDGETICLSNIVAVKDYSVILSANDNILCVGGAISLDRSWRIAKEKHINMFSKDNSQKLYWDGEAPFFDENILHDILERNIEISFVVTHSAPSFITKISTNEIDAWKDHDLSLIKDIQNERKVFDKIYDFLICNNMPLKGWFFGHYKTDSYFKSKEYVTFIGMSNSFNYYSISNVFEDRETKFLKTSGISPLRTLNLGRPIRFHDENPHPLEDFEVEENAENNARLNIDNIRDNLENAMANIAMRR